MAKIKLWYLHCYQSEESAKQPIQPGDELELSIEADGEHSTMRRNRMWSGRRWDLDVILEFQTQVEISLRDLDNPRVGDEHDELGKFTISPGMTEGAFTFDGHGTAYELRWGPS